MVKKKGQDTSKKVVQKQKEKKLEDLTFGLKNKNKSAKVKQYVQATEKAIKNEGMSARARQLEEQKKQAKIAMKEKKKAEEDELTLLRLSLQASIGRLHGAFANNLSFLRMGDEDRAMLNNFLRKEALNEALRPRAV